MGGHKEVQAQQSTGKCGGVGKRPNCGRNCASLRLLDGVGYMGSELLNFTAAGEGGELDGAHGVGNERREEEAETRWKRNADMKWKRE